MTFKIMVRAVVKTRVHGKFHQAALVIVLADK